MSGWVPWRGEIGAAYRMAPGGSIGTALLLRRKDVLRRPARRATFGVRRQTPSAKSGAMLPSPPTWLIVDRGTGRRPFPVTAP